MTRTNTTTRSPASRKRSTSKRDSDHAPRSMAAIWLALRIAAGKLKLILLIEEDADADRRTRDRRRDLPPANREASCTSGERSPRSAQKYTVTWPISSVAADDRKVVMTSPATPATP